MVSNAARKGVPCEFHLQTCCAFEVEQENAAVEFVLKTDLAKAWKTPDERHHRLDGDFVFREEIKVVGVTMAQMEGGQSRAVRQIIGVAKLRCCKPRKKDFLFASQNWILAYGVQPVTSALRSSSPAKRDGIPR